MSNSDLRISPMHRFSGVENALEPVFRGGFDSRTLVQRGQETVATAAFSHLLDAGLGEKLFGQGRRPAPFHGNLLPRSQLGNLPVYRVRYCQLSVMGA
jgi:hypothetical protein